MSFLAIDFETANYKRNSACSVGLVKVKNNMIIERATYYDSYGDNNIGQLGYGFSLILLSKYGGKKHPDTFYVEKYFKAFRSLLESINPTYTTLEIYTAECYSLRTFDRFLNYFGLINIEEEEKVRGQHKYITKTDLYDKLIKCKPHNPS